MSERVPVQDVVCLAVPEDVDPTRDQLREFLMSLAEQTTWFQYMQPGWVRPAALQFESIDWLITQDIDDVEKFQPAHDCERCRQGNVQAIAFLKENPGRWIAMGNLTYIEEWE